MKNKLRVYSWMLFDWACQPFHTLIVTFIFAPYFATFIVGDAKQGQELIGMAATIAGVIVAIFSPFLGSFADQTQKRKPWVLVFSIVLIISTASLWFAEPKVENIMWVLVAYLLAYVAVDFATVFTNSMMPGLETNENMGKLSGYAWGLGYIGGLISLIIMLTLFIAKDTGLTFIGIDPIFGFDSSKNEGERIVGPITALWYFIFIMPFFIFVPEVKIAQSSEFSFKEAAKTLFSNFKALKEDKDLAYFLLASMFYRDAMGAIFIFGGIYAKGILGMSTVELGIFGILAAMTGTFGAYLGGYLDSKYGPKFCITIMLGGLLIVVLVILGLSRESFYGIPLNPSSASPDIIFYVAGGILGFVSGPIQSASRTFLVFLVDEKRITEGFGLYALVGRGTAWLAPALITLFTWLGGSQQAGLAPIIFLLFVGWYLLRFVTIKYRIQ